MKNETNTAVPAAPESDTVLIGQAVCYGDDWFKELTVEGVTFLAPLDDHQRAIHILAAKKRRPQPAAPAPVAGDAVAARIRGLIADIDPQRKPATGEMLHVANELRSIAALAQDRASQGAAAGVPEADHEK